MSALRNGHQSRHPHRLTREQEIAAYHHHRHHNHHHRYHRVLALHHAAPPLTGKNSGENWSPESVAQAIATAARDTNMKHPKLLGNVANAESKQIASADGWDSTHKHIVSRGLMQIKPDTLLGNPQKKALGILDAHKEQMIGLLSKPEYGDRFKPVLDWMHGDHSKANHDAVIKKMYDPQLSAYAGALYLKDMGADHNPTQAYLNYVSPAMGQVIAKAAKNGNGASAAQLAAANGVSGDVVRNNPNVFGAGGSFSASQIVNHNNQKFTGVVEKEKSAKTRNGHEVVRAEPQGSVKPKQKVAVTEHNAHAALPKKSSAGAVLADTLNVPSRVGFGLGGPGAM